MALIPVENGTSGPDDGDIIPTEDEHSEFYNNNYYYYYDYSDGVGGGVNLPYLVFDVLLAVAVIVDLMLVIVVLSSKKLRRGPSAVFILSLATFDMLHLVSIRVFLHVMWKYEMYPAGQIFCTLGVFVDAMFGNTTVFILVALAAERYVAVVHPLTAQKRSVGPITWSIACVVLTWLLATVLAVPDIFTHSMEDIVFTRNVRGKLPSGGINETMTDDDMTSANDAVNSSMMMGNEGRHCTLVGDGWLSWYPSVRPALGFVVSYAVPVMLIGMLQGEVVRKLLRATPQCYATGDRSFFRRKQAARSLIAFIVVVVVCMLPVHVLALLTDYDLVDTDRLYALAYVSFYMFAANSVFNAVLVSVVSHQYRQQVLVLLGVLRCRRSRQQDTASGEWKAINSGRRINENHIMSSPVSSYVQSTRI